MSIGEYARLHRGAVSTAPPLAFHSVNVPDRPGYRRGLQRHHLLPRQLTSVPWSAKLIDSLGAQSIGFEDFRTNGLLLPGDERLALRLALPLHRGPHPVYNELVAERVGTIERQWQVDRRTDIVEARRTGLMRLRLLQAALRKRLLTTSRRPLRLNRHDPLGRDVDFSELDDLVGTLWSDTADAVNAGYQAAS